MAQFQTYTKTKLDELLGAKASATAVTTNTTDIATLKANAVTVAEDSSTGVITITYGA